MSVVRRIAIGENHKSAEVLNRPTDDILTLSGLTPGATFPGFLTAAGITGKLDVYAPRAGEVGVTNTQYPVEDIRRYGAVSGTDCTTAIMNRLASATAAGGGRVLLPREGTYLVTPGGAAVVFTLTSGVSVEGEGPTSVLKVIDAAGNYGKLFAASAQSNMALRNFRINQNPLANTSATIPAANTTSSQYVATFDQCQNVTVEGMTFDTLTGVCAVVASGAGTANVKVRGCTFTFVRHGSYTGSGSGKSSTVEPAWTTTTGYQFVDRGVVWKDLGAVVGGEAAWVADTTYATGAIVRPTVANGRRYQMLGVPVVYDHTAVYVDGVRTIVSDNTFNSVIGQTAYSAIETHSGPATVTENVSDAYMTLHHVTPETTGAATDNSGPIVSTGNTAKNALTAIRLWPWTGKTLRNVTITGNGLAISQYAQRGDEMCGIRVECIAACAGDIDGLTIGDNTISFEMEPGGGRVIGGSNAADGIALTPYSGTIRNFTLAPNTIINAPSRGLRLGNSQVGVGKLRGGTVGVQTIIDAGQNAALAGTQRASVGLEGDLYNLTIDRAHCIDTGAGALNGVNSVYLVTYGGQVLTRVKVRQFDEDTVSGIAFARSLPAAFKDTYLDTDQSGVITGGGWLKKASSIGPGAIPIGGIAQTTVAVSGAAVGDFVIVSSEAATAVNLILWGFVSAAGTVTVRIMSSTAQTVSALVVYVAVLKS